MGRRSELPICRPRATASCRGKSFVVPNFRHHGLAAQLMEQFIDYAHQHSYTVKIMCPYAKQYFKLHPEAQSFSCRKIVVQRSCKDGSK